jgi:hypothetical protein
MSALNTAIFLKLNAAPDAPHWLEFLAQATAVIPVGMAAAVLVGLWIWGNPARRGPLLAVAAGLIMAFILTAPFAFLLYTPRPGLDSRFQPFSDRCRTGLGMDACSSGFHYSLGADLSRHTLAA